MAGAPTFPESFRDPQYAALDQSTEQSLGLPDGLLSSIRMNGERSNASAVSSAGARTPYQITPATRQAAIDKYGVDPYLSPQNASDVAGRLLADSLQRNQNNLGAAVGEYIGGTDRSNWGKQTSAYVQRVLGGLPGGATAVPMSGPGAGAAPSVQGFSGPSTFDRAQANLQQAQAPSQLNNLYQAYASGQMSPQDRADYESDVQSGKMMLPPGASLQAAAQPGAGGATSGAAAPPIPVGVAQAFQSGQMNPQDAKEFEQDVRAGAFSLPQGMTADDIFGAKAKPMGLGARVAEAITGDKRATQWTQQLPNWTDLPELNHMSLADIKTAFGTIAGDGNSIAKSVQANLPGVQVNQDAKGNIIFKSGEDGKYYAIKPGFQPSDIPRGLAQVGAFALANEVMPGAGVRGILPNMVREGAVGAAGQAGLEGVTAAGGGQANWGSVPVAAGLGSMAPVVGAAARGVAAPAMDLLARVRGTGNLSAAAESGAPALGKDAAMPAAAAPVEAPITVDGAGVARTPGQAAAPAAPAAATVPPVAPTAAAAPAVAPSVQDVSQAARSAAGGSKPSIQQLAELSAPDANVTAAAKRLGIEDYLQPDHVTSSDAYRQVLGVLKSNPTSQMALGESAGLAQVGKRASELVDEAGGQTDVGAQSAGVKAQMSAAHADATNLENGLWTKLRASVPPKTEAPAENALGFAQQRADELGGVQNLTPMERQIVAKLTPKGGNADMLQALAPAARQQAIEQGAQTARQPTYALLDDVRKDAGMAARQGGPFSDADTGLAKRYYGLLSSDQEAAAKAVGAGDLAQQAKAATAVRKGMEDDMASLFGKNLDQSMAPKLSFAMRAAAAGNHEPLVNLLAATPDTMRQQVVATGLGTVIRNAAGRGDISFAQFSKWWGNLQRNQPSFNAVMTHLSPEARQQISDLATVSKAIDASQQARIRTGLRTSVLDEMSAPDTLATRMFDLAKHFGKGLAADAIGGHGAGIAMGLMSALKGANKPSTLKALDDVLTSPEFVQMARSAGTPGQQEAARAMAYSRPFTRFARSVGNAPELSDRQRFILSALQGATNGEANVSTRH